MTQSLAVLPVRMSIARINCRALLFSVLLIVSSAHCGPHVSYAEEPTILPPWSLLESQLEADVQQAAATTSTFEEQLLSSAGFTRVRSIKRQSVWLDMVYQRRHPLVTMAGFLAIRDVMPDMADEVAMRTFVLRERGISLAVYEPVVEHLKAMRFRERSAASFATVITEATHVFQGPLMIEVALLNATFLNDWLESDYAEKVPVTGLAVVLDGTLARRDVKPLTPQRLVHLLELLSAGPGYPRAVYIANTRDRSGDFELHLRSVLGDENVKVELESIIQFHGEYVQRELDSGTVKLSPARAAEIRQILQKQKRARR